jgi:hypothetical protein
MIVKQETFIISATAQHVMEGDLAALVRVQLTYNGSYSLLTQVVDNENDVQSRLYVQYILRLRISVSN